ncbi:LOW QUALITY PROTEIN: hypothetical protein U0070_020657, partial [Myodes glareolus]
MPCCKTAMLNFLYLKDLVALGDKVPACLHVWKSCLRIELEIMRGYFLLRRQFYVGISNKESQRVQQICNSSGAVEELADTRPQEDSGDSLSSHQSLDPNRHPLPILHLVCGLLHIKRHAKRKAKGNREMLSEATASGNDRLRIYPDRQEAWIKKIIGDTELINFSKVSRIRKMILEDDKGKYCPTVEESRVLENGNVTTGFNLTAVTSAQKASAQDPSKTDTSNFPVGMRKKKKASEHDQKGSIYSWHIVCHLHCGRKDVKELGARKKSTVMGIREREKDLQLRHLPYEKAKFAGEETYSSRVSACQESLSGPCQGCAKSLVDDDAQEINVLVSVSHVGEVLSDYY